MDEHNEVDEQELSEDTAEAVEPTSEATVETTEAPAAEAAAVPVVEIVRGEREFHVGGSVIKEDESTAGLSSEEARKVLQSAFPEVANATLRESVKDGVSVVEFLPQPGRKG